MLEYLKQNAQAIFNIFILVALLLQVLLNFIQNERFKIHTAWLKNHGEHLDLHSGWIKRQSKNVSRIYGLMGGKTVEELEKEDNSCH